MRIDSSPGREIKRAFDVCFGVVLGIVALPAAILIAGLVRYTSPGPVLIRQQRLGRNGVPFRLYKFRSMFADAENGVAVWAPANDPRCTPLGGFLRRTGLDEIPQLWNALKGEMSLVGPRPERPEFAADFAVSLPGYGDRLRVQPGLTGLAQIRGWRGDTSVAERLRADLEYISKWTPMLDVWILWRTLGECLKAGVRGGRTKDEGLRTKD